MLFNRPDTEKCLFPWGRVHCHLIHGSLDHPTQHPVLHLDRFNRFCTDHGRESL